MAWFGSRALIQADISTQLGFLEEYCGDIEYDNLRFDANTQGVDGTPDHTVNVYGAVIVENSEDVDKARKRTVNYIVIDEGLAGEKAQYFDEAKKNTYPIEDIARTAIIDYIKAFPTYRGFELIYLDTSNTFKFAKLKVYLHETDHIEEKLFIVYKDGTAAMDHEEITVTV